jgi:hypothetical protein
MGKLDYPTDKLQILFLTEEDDAETRAAIMAEQLPEHFQIVIVPDGEPRTKPRACNYGLLMATGDYLVIFDAEDKPDPLQLKKAVLAFANCGPELGCVQAKLNFYNPTQNILTRWFTAEYSAWFDTTLPGLQWANLSLPLGGTSNHFRTSTLTQLGAWDPFNVTEDCDLGLRMARYGYKTVVLASTTLEEANPAPKNWIRQRSRWIKGYMQTFLVHMRRPEQYLSPSRWRELFSLQLIVGARTSILLINPIMWALLIIYIFLRPFVEDTYHILFPGSILYMAVLCLIFGNLLYIYVHFTGSLKRGDYYLIKWTLAMPLYWAMGSIAAYKALYQLITKPHYWEKTSHGLHLPNTQEKKPAPPEAVIMNPLGSPQLAYGYAGNGAETPAESTRSSPRMAKYHATVSAMRTISMQPVNGAVDYSGVIALPNLGGKRGSGLRMSKYRTMSMAVQALTPSTPTNGKHQSAPMPTKVQSRISTARSSIISRILKDHWLLLTFATACVASIAALLYFFQNNQLLLYNDAFSHLAIARRVVDNVTPGAAQLGGIWLPLPHVAMLPFIWNDYLWHTGLAGSFVSMPCFIISAIYIFLSARRLTANNVASFIGTLAFILNPNILYLQTTALSELVFIATMTVSCYYFLAWAQDEKASQLMLTALAVFLATLARYDGWPLFIAFFGLIVIIGFLKRMSWQRIEAGLITFGAFGALGIALWFLWCALIFGDPLYFQRSEYSAQAQQQLIIASGQLFTYHNVIEALRYFGYGVIDTIGPALFVLGIIAVGLFILRRRFAPDALVALTLLVPTAFYVFSLYSGQAAFYVPQAVPANFSHQMFNLRYASVAVPPLAVFLATLAGTFKLGTPLRNRPLNLSLRAGLLRVNVLLQIVCIVIIAGQTVATAASGIITLQSGQFGDDCMPHHPIVNYLAAYYSGGTILGEDVVSNTNLPALIGPTAGIDFKNFIYEGSGKLWREAFRNPVPDADWLFLNPRDPNDKMMRKVDINTPEFMSTFILAAQDPDGLSLYHRGPLPTSPVHVLPANFGDEHDLCRH